MSSRQQPALTVAEISERLGIQPHTWTSYVSRGQAPEPDGHYDERTPYWLTATIEAYERDRQGRRGRPRKQRD